MCSQPSSDVPEYFSLLPSEICRLILGYLRHNGHHNAACSLFLDSNELAELRTQYSRLSDLPMHLTQITLIDLIQDYLRVANSVAHLLSRTNLSCKLGSIATVLPHLLKSNVTGAIRISTGRPMRAPWLPAGKSYLPPRVVTPDRVGTTQNNLRLPLVAVRPHLYSATPVFSPKPTNPRLCGPCTSSTSMPSCSVPVNAIPLISSTPEGRPLIRLVRHSTATSVPPASMYCHESNSCGFSGDVSERKETKSSSVSASQPTQSPSLDKTGLTPVIARSWSSQTETAPDCLPPDDEELTSCQPSRINEDQREEIVVSKLYDHITVPSTEFQSNTKEPVTHGCPEISSVNELQETEISVSKQYDHTAVPSVELQSDVRDPVIHGCSTISALTEHQESEVIVSQQNDHMTVPSTSTKDQASPEYSTASSLKATSPVAVASYSTDSVNSPPSFSISVTRDSTCFDVTETCSTFTVLKHLPPQLETKRLSRDSESVAREERQPSVQPGHSRRRRYQTPRHMPSGQVATTDVVGSVEDQNDVDFQRFLSALFSKPEHLATHINAKLGNISSRSGNATSVDSSASVREGHTNSRRVSSSKIENIMDKNFSESKPTLSSEKRLQPTFGPVEHSMSPRNLSTELVESEIPNPILDWLQDDLESCIDQLLSQFDCDQSTTDQGDHPDEEKYNNQSIDHSGTVTPVEVIDLMLPSGASTPAYPLCSSVKTVSTTEIATTSTIDMVPEVQIFPPTTPTEPGAPIRPNSSPPLCLSQLARGTDSPHKRRRLDINNAKERRAFKPCGPSTAALLQTPEFKNNSMPTEDAELPRHDLFSNESQMEAYEDYINIRTMYDSPETEHKPAYNPSHFVSQSLYLNAVSRQPNNTTSGPVPSTLPASQLSPMFSSGSSVDTHVPSSFCSTSNFGIYSTVNHSSVLSSTAAYQGLMTAEPVVNRLPHKGSLVPTTLQPINSNLSVVNSVYTMDSNQSNGQIASVAVSPASIQAPTSLLTSLHQSHGFETTQQVSVDSSSFHSVLSHPATSWSESAGLFPNGLHTLPLIPLDEPKSFSSVPTLMFYQPTVATSATISSPSAVDTRTLQPIHYNTSSPSADEFVQASSSSSMYNSVLFQLPKGGAISWNASSGSTLLIPVNVDLDSPNPHGLTSASQSSPLPCLPMHPKVVPSPTSVPETRVNRDGSSLSAINSASTRDKENQQPPLIIQKKNARRKILNLGSIDVDQILSKSHSD